jgi:hypothetical protein
MPTKKPAKKRAPRTDWKHLVELQNREIGNLRAGLNGARDARDLLLEDRDRLVGDGKAWEGAATTWENRALAAEKHNALLLAEREARDMAVKISTAPFRLIDAPPSRCPTCNDHCVANVYSEQTHGAAGKATELKPILSERLKSRAAKWSVEITCALAILAVFAVASWYALRWGK